jgi:hypothetical protein
MMLMIQCLAFRLFIIPVEMQHEICACMPWFSLYQKSLSAGCYVWEQPGVQNEMLLYIMRCRDKTLRKEAIGLLYKNPKGEGLWDSLIAAELAEWFIDQTGGTPQE